MHNPEQDNDLSMTGREWGLGLGDIEQIAALQEPEPLEHDKCAECQKPIFRQPDFLGITPVWRHKSSGAELSYSPDIHSAVTAFPVLPHKHNWVVVDKHLDCMVGSCGARKMAVQKPQTKGVFMSSIKEMHLAESRQRGAARGGQAQRLARAGLESDLD